MATRGKPDTEGPMWQVLAGVWQVRGFKNSVLAGVWQVWQVMTTLRVYARVIPLPCEKTAIHARACQRAINGQRSLWI